ncbi:methylthioribulose 1-phosphate dehydratase [Streptomyces sp. WMMB 322]|uniref:methylthioribulose 1-phosphate dehydratase n=1 Tax=Streptomyces sp. WMMB 322 TaxID=1286821 RepID=UPI0006E31F22|nr:methylthioribulose 1-phosphate dehydratase [Streptomyces sp. WMMB 322]SCK10792.1 methylthioribulose-1-phosphate dehydratase [Streptomyces sp. WMMB 322]
MSRPPAAVRSAPSPVPQPPAAPAGHSAGAAAQAAEIARCARDLYERGWMPGTSGNLSVRLRGELSGTALITASGRSKGELNEDDMVAVDAETGEALRTGAPRASAETAIHAAVYRTTRAGAVIHVHSPFATAVACGTDTPERQSTLELSRFELLKGLGLDDPSRTGIPVFPNRPVVAELAREVAARLREAPQGPPALLVVDHGITVWGRDLTQARNRLECIESICQLCTLGARSVTFRPAA